MRIWTADDPGTTSATYDSHTKSIRSMVELTDGNIASASDDGTIRIWDPASPDKTIATYRGHTTINSVVLLDDGRVASAGADGVHLWDPTDP